MQFNEKLKALRIKRQLTQEDIAEKLSISRQSISKWEQGINEPDIQTLKQLCIILDVGIEELIDDDKEVIVSSDLKIKKASLVLFKIQTGILIFTILFFFILIKFVPDQIALNYNFSGEVTRYGSKWGLLIPLCIGLVPYILSIVFFDLIKKDSYEYKKNGIVFLSISLGLQVILTSLIIVVTCLEIKINNESIGTLMTGLLASLILPLAIFSSPKFNKTPNFVFGYRTKFAVRHQDAWKKLNWLTSIIMGVISIVIYILALVFNSTNLVYLNLIYIGAVFITIIYEIILKKKN